MFLAILVENFYQVLTDHLRVAAFDVVALYKVNQLAVFKQCDRRGRGRVWQRELTRFRYRFFIDTGKYRCKALGLFIGVLKSPFNARAGSSCSTAANGVYNKKGRSLLIFEVLLNLLRSF